MTRLFFNKISYVTYQNNNNNNNNSNDGFSIGKEKDLI